MKPFVLSLFFASAVWAQPEMIASGLQGPQRLILTPRGNLLVTETSLMPGSGRISVVTRQGSRRSLIEGLPSGRELAGGGSGPTAMAIRDRTLYFAMGGGDLARRGQVPGTEVHNPEGASSVLFSLIMEVRFGSDIDALSGTFRLTAPQLRALHDGEEIELADGAGGTARMSVLARFPLYEPDPVTIYRFSNPWGLALSADGRTLFVADASFNCLFRVDTATGRWRRIARFAPLANPGVPGPPVFDFVPTSVRLDGDQLLVSYLTGFPFVPGMAGAVLVNPETGATTPFMYSLTSTTDVLVRDRPADRPQFFALEFSVNQSATPAPPGRLLRFDSAEPIVAIPVLITPVSLAFDPASNDLFILELRGQIHRLKVE